MKRIATSESLAEIAHLRNVLEQRGLRCLIKNEQLSGALGEIPFLECLPELWLLDEDRLDEAEDIIETLREQPSFGEPWCCTHCGERNEQQFAQCWRCGHEDA